MITKYSHTSYDGTQWFLKFIQPTKLIFFIFSLSNISKISNLKCIKVFLSILYLLLMCYWYLLQQKVGIFIECELLNLGSRLEII